MNQEKINRINELYKKSKTVGLSDAEIDEQKQLRTEYRMAILGNITSSLENVKIKNPDGSIEDLKPTKSN